MNSIKWSTLEFEEKDRHADWVWYTGLVFVISAILSFFYGNIFFGIFLIISGASVIMYSIRKPKMITVTIDDKGVLIDKERIAYDRIKQFWIDETEKTDKLLMLVKGSFVPILTIPLSSVTAQSVRSKMLISAPEVFMRESLGTKIADRLGF